MTKIENKGFTLIELLVVVAIIGVLASVVLVSLNSARAKSRDARRLSDLREIANALHTYYSDNQQFPNETSDSSLPASALVPEYISSIPRDPLSGNNYRYETTGCSPPNQAFALNAGLETSHNALNGDIDGTRCGLVCNDPAYCIDQ